MSEEYEANNDSQIVPNHLGETQLEKIRGNLLSLNHNELMELLKDTKYADLQAEIIKQLYVLKNKK